MHKAGFGHRSAPQWQEGWFTPRHESRAHTPPMSDNKPTGTVARERRAQQAAVDAAKLREGLTPRQLGTVASMKAFQWELRFVRRPMFLAPIPVLFSHDGQRMVILEADGSINENPGFKIRS